MTAHNDLAGYTLVDTYVPEQLFCGEIQIATNQGIVVTAAVTKYQLLAHLADDTVTAFIPGTHTIPQAVIAAQPAVVGAHCPFFHEGYFNVAMITVAAGDGTLNTPAKMKAAFNGQSNLKFGQFAAGS